MSDDDDDEDDDGEDDNDEDDDEEDPNNGTGVATGKVSDQKYTKGNSPIVIDSDEDVIKDHSDLFEDDVDGDESDSEVSPSNHSQEQRSCLGLRRGIVCQGYQVPRTFDRQEEVHFSSPDSSPNLQGAFEKGKVG
jgi:hypothetical protein